MAGSAAGSASGHGHVLPWHTCQSCGTWVYEWRLQKAGNICKCGAEVPYERAEKQKDEKADRASQKERLRKAEADHCLKGSLPIQKPAKRSSNPEQSSGKASASKWEQAIGLLASYLGSEADHPDLFAALASVAPKEPAVKAVDPDTHASLKQELKGAKQDKKKTELLLEKANSGVRDSAASIRSIKIKLEREHINWTSAKAELSTAQNADKRAADVIKEIVKNIASAESKAAAAVPPSPEGELQEAYTSPEWEEGEAETEDRSKRKCDISEEREEHPKKRRKAITLTAAAHTDAVDAAGKAKQAARHQSWDRAGGAAGHPNDDDDGAWAERRSRS